MDLAKPSASFALHIMVFALLTMGFALLIMGIALHVMGIALHIMGFAFLIMGIALHIMGNALFKPTPDAVGCKVSGQRCSSYPLRPRRGGCNRVEGDAIASNGKTTQALTNIHFNIRVNQSNQRHLCSNFRFCINILAKATQNFMTLLPQTEVGAI